MSRRIALIVGVSQYDKTRTGLDSLAAPVNDAQRVYEVLAEYGGFDELYPLPLAQGEVDRSGWVTAQELRAKLHEVLNPQLADEVELAVFYFSGHGINPDGQVAYLSASDKPLAVAISHIAKLAKHSAVKNICIWLDCCHSGEMLEFSDLTDKGFCVVAASHADGEALAADGNSLLTNLLCEALTPLNGNPPEIRVMDFIQTIAAKGKNLPQQVVCLARGNTAFTLTQFHGETTVTSAYPPDYPPYKGLLTFTKDDSPFFFGRDGMIQQLLDKLSASRFVALLGASGSGKSSLVLAGLLPKLPESDWQVLVMRPTAQPLQNLRDTLVRGFPDAQVGTLASGADLQREVLRLVTAGKRLLLVIDQFEEVFTECHDDVARAAFFACLLEALDSDNPLHLVLTLRADFLGHCTEQAYSGLGQRLQHHTLLLVAPTAGELREAITRPLALVGMRCEQALEDELVDQTLHAKGSLPLLQYVLEKLWQSARQERSRELTLAMYRQLGGQHGGGLRGVLNEKADAFYQQLEPQQQRLMEWLMVELTQVGDGQDDTRHTVTLQELHNRQPQYTAALDALLAQLVTHERLLTQDHDDYGQATITVAHEALIRDWQRLRGWLESNREIKSWRLRLEDSITAWKNNVSGSLLREKRLAEAQQIIGRNPSSLLIGQNERAFIAASQTEEKRRKQLWIGSSFAFVMVLLVGIAATIWQWQEAKQQAYTALVAKLSNQAKLATSSPSLANGYVTQGLLLVIQSFRLNTQQSFTQGLLWDTLQETHLQRVIYLGSVAELDFSPDGKFIISADDSLRLWSTDNGQLIGRSNNSYKHIFNNVTFSPTGRHVITCDSEGALYLWDVTTGVPSLVGEAWRGHEGNINGLAFSPDGKYVISGGWDKTLRLWDVESGKTIGEPWQVVSNDKEEGGRVTALAFSPDGKYVISSSWDKALRLWDVRTGKTIGSPWTGNEFFAFAIAFSPDGKYIVSGDNIMENTLRLWDVATRKIVGEPWKGHIAEGGVTSISFSPDGKYVVSSADNNTTFLLWDIATGQTISTPWQGHEGNIRDVKFSPDGKYIASTGVDKTLRLWNIASGQSITESWSPKLESGISALAFSPDGKYIVTSGFSELLLWNIANKKPADQPWQGHRFTISTIAFSPDSKYVVSGSWDKTLRQWNVASGQSEGEPWHEYKQINALAFSHDGHSLISAAGNCLRLWNVAINTQPVGKLWCEHEKTVRGVAFSPDDRYVISGSDDETLQLWDTSTGKTIGQPWRGHEAPVMAAAFSPDGRYVISGSTDETLRLWDISTGKTIGQPWRGHGFEIDDIAFSPDGRFVVSRSFNSVRLWNTASRQVIGTLWQGYKEPIQAVAFSPDGGYVAIGGDEGILRLWDADPESWAKKACSIVNRNFSLAEWQRFIGDALPYEKTCPDLPAPGEEGWVEPYAGG
ncbi:MAG: caspase family protein [Gammaproteobacteria bacterium]|nr:caspase family protein [Gammaproteobacteria bacterium]MBU1725381.1 caspase family protein [Gammaproteobacteria bacterium]MBU2006112.1 caspase family protein [Gammaproteobacteria bacterium]